MIRTWLKIIPTVFLLGLVVSCHPEAFYGPKSFGYNTTGVVSSNLVGLYTFDGTNASVLQAKGFTNTSGSLQLNADMTFVCEDIPSIMNIPKPGLYFSTSGKWRPIQSGAIWKVELYDIDFKTTGGYATLTFPVVGESPPHGIELAISHDEGYYIRYKRSENAR